MGEMRTYIRTIVSGNGEVHTPVRIHTPRQLLEKAGVTLGTTEKAQRNRWYRNGWGNQVKYRPVSQSEYDKLKDEQEREASARVSTAATLAKFEAPPPSRNSLRGKSGRSTYGVVHQLQRRIEQQEMLIQNARVREMELRHNIIQGGGYGAY